jgi:hypothetical protein
MMHHEESRRKFLANATLAIGGVVDLVIAVPAVVSLVPALSHHRRV